jgi:hypothetical protein
MDNLHAQRERERERERTPVHKTEENQGEKMSKTDFLKRKKKREKHKLFSLYSCANRTNKCVREKNK